MVPNTTAVISITGIICPITISIPALSTKKQTLSQINDVGTTLIFFSISDEIYIEQILSPSLSPGQIVIMHNLSIHTGEKVRQAIEARGCRLLFLPSYSPDLSPTEEAFSKLKTVLRRTAARTHEALQEA